MCPYRSAIVERFRRPSAHRSIDKLFQLNLTRASIRCTRIMWHLLRTQCLRPHAARTHTLQTKAIDLAWPWHDSDARYLFSDWKSGYCTSACRFRTDQNKKAISIHMVDLMPQRNVAYQTHSRYIDRWPRARVCACNCLRDLTFRGTSDLSLTAFIDWHLPLPPAFFPIPCISGALPITPLPYVPLPARNQ